MKASQRIVSLYEENAAAWDRMRGRDLHERRWLDRFLAMLQPGGTILDIGCGMGEPIARHLIDRGFRVTGIDSSPSLISMCRTRFPDHDWVVADVRALSLGRRFDGLIAWHSAFFHLTPEDQVPLFAIMAAHAAPGAAFMFTSGPRRGEELGEWQGEALYHGSLDPEDYRALLEQNGFGAISNRERDPDCGSATVWLASRANGRACP